MSNIISISKGFSKQDKLNCDIVLSRLKENMEGPFHQSVRMVMKPTYHKASHSFINAFVEGAISEVYKTFSVLSTTDFKGTDFSEILQGFIDDLNDSDYASLNIPFESTTTTLLFARLTGTWVLYDIYLNHESITSMAFKKYMEENNKTVEDVF